MSNTMQPPADAREPTDAQINVWSIIRSALSRVWALSRPWAVADRPQVTSEVVARLDAIAADCEREVLSLLRTPRGEGEPVAYMVTASRYSGGGVEWVRDWLFRGPAECEEHVRWLHRPQSRWQDVRVTPLYAARRGEGGGE